MADDDWRTVVRNIVKAQKVWWRMLRILNRERARLRISGFFFKAVIQLVFLFNAESWVVTPHMVRYLRVFQYQVEKRLVWRLPWQSLNGRWENILEEASKVDEGLRQWRSS